MNRSEFLKATGAGIAGLLLSEWFIRAMASDPELTKALFGEDFHWGTAICAFQTEGAWNTDGKGESIWDHFSHKTGNIYKNSNADVACDFYHLYEKDLKLLQYMNFKDFRFSIAWTRVLPEGTGTINEKGIDYYNRLIDKCIELGITPWVTLYHWDLPQALEDKGGWANRNIVDWFTEYTDLCTKRFGDRVKNWIVINEPAAVTTLGYLTGLHAPGHTNYRKYLSSIHYILLCQAEGGRKIRANVPDAHIGTALSCSYVEPYKNQPRNIKASHRIDALLNRLFIEPTLGMGYPTDSLPFLKRMESIILPGDMEKLRFDFDFIGLQNYFRVIGKRGIIPLVWANSVKPDTKEEGVTQMGWEIYPQGIYQIIKQFAKYPIKEIVITENGAAFKDILSDDHIHDTRRISYFREYLGQVLKAKNEGVNIKGYFVWSLMDNFEWSMGYKPKFGLLYTDFQTQKRIIKDSGYWFRDFLK